MRYLEFRQQPLIKEIATALVENYKLVEARIADEELEIILQRVNDQLLKELGPKSTRTALRQVLVNHGFKKDLLNKILAGIDAPATSSNQPQTDTDDHATSAVEKPNEQPSEKPTEKPHNEPSAHKTEEPAQPKFNISIPNDDAKKILKGLAYQYPGLDTDLEKNLRNLAQDAVKYVDVRNVNQVHKTLTAQLNLINQAISNVKSQASTVNENASAGSTSTGMGASLAMPIGANATIRRMDPEQSFFLPAQSYKKQIKKLRKKSKKH